MTTHPKRCAKLESLGYQSYERVNARFIAVDDCVNSTGANCQQGLTLSHLEVWKRIVASKQRRSLVVEDDVTFHSDARILFSRYLDEIPRAWGVIYIGQLSRLVFDHDPLSVPLTTLTQFSVMPWCTHAYFITFETAEFLLKHLEHLLSRSGSAFAGSKHFMNPDVSEQSPWRMNAIDMKIDFFMLSVHNYYVLNKTVPQWFTFESTALAPAKFLSYSWSKNAEIEIGNSNAGPECAWGKTLYVSCEDALMLSHDDPRRICGVESGRLPVMGTGLAYQNKCKINPFAIFGWETLARNRTANSLTVPSCEALRARLRPSETSDPTPVDCNDAAVPQEGVVLFSLPNSGEEPQLWNELLKDTIMATGSTWMDRSKPPSIITAHGMPCGRATVGRCDVPFIIRPGTTDSGASHHHSCALVFVFGLTLCLQRFSGR